MSAFEQSQQIERVLGAAVSRLRKIEERIGIRIILQFGEPASESSLTELSEYDLVLCVHPEQDHGRASWSLHFAFPSDLANREIHLPFQAEQLEPRIRNLGRKLATDLRQTSPSLALIRFLDGFDKGMTPSS